MDKKVTWAAFKKSDAERQIMYAEVYAPNLLDSDGDFMTADAICDSAHEFMKKKLLDKVDLQHDNKLYGCYIVESFIARKDDELFLPESWVVGIHIPDADMWTKVIDGEINGVSMEFMALTKELEVEIEIPNEFRGITQEADGHSHKYELNFDPETGNLVSASVDAAEDGHTHAIRKGTATEETDGHSHRFEFLSQYVQ